MRAATIHSVIHRVWMVADLRGLGGNLLRSLPQLKNETGPGGATNTGPAPDPLHPSMRTWEEGADT